MEESKKSAGRRRIGALGAGAAVLLCLCSRPAAAAEGRLPERMTVAPVSAEARLRSVLDCMARGRRLFREGDYLHAAMQFEKVLELDSSNTSAEEYLKRCEEKLRRD